MIVLLPLALQAAAPALGPIGRQQLPAHGCAAFLWSADEADRTRGPVAMAVADPAALRLALDGAAPVDLPRVAQHGEGGFGLAGSTDYRVAGVAATLTLTVAPREGLRDGAMVPHATLSIARDGHDELVVPLAGLIGCRPAS